ncbi:hypothetical protein [Pleionea sediminis]|uniref:hypothetical protein n=1 Tax=Pleionea sediminis TaxID=2569479 RepID=UPI001185BAAA|nr:hypothetical protein [Pleionea sediminis]
MDENEFIEELAKLPFKYALPIALYDTNGVIQPGNATTTLIKYQDQYFCVTNNHVIEKLLDVNPSQCYCQIGMNRIDIWNAEIIRSKNQDVCLIKVDEEFDLSFKNIDELKFNVEFYRLTKNYEVQEGDIVSFGGYPGCFRTVENNRQEICYGTYSHAGLPLNSLSNLQGSVWLNDNTDKKALGSLQRDDLTALGGISGAPVFKWEFSPIAVPVWIGVVVEGDLHRFQSEHSQIIVDFVSERTISELLS